MLKEVVPVSENLAQVAATGLEALDYIERRQKPSAAWIAGARRQLQDAARPRSEVTLAIVDPVTRLVEKAGQL
jgi:hypothetical protein